LVIETSRLVAQSPAGRLVFDERSGRLVERLAPNLPLTAGRIRWYDFDGARIGVA
jgi:hypothetical protein